MLHELETGDAWEVIEARAHLLVIKRERDGLLRTILNDDEEYVSHESVLMAIGVCNP